ncbi:MAG: cysteine desulfurase family protein [Pseudomonadota bacterium]
MQDSPVYLDHNATTPMRPAAIDAMSGVLGLTGNPSSVHSFGRNARKLLDQARGAVADLVGADPAEVVFTSGGSEANDLALNGLSHQELPLTVIASAGEHDSVRKAAPQTIFVPLTGDGRIDLSALEGLLASQAEPALVSVMLANNETGVVQPLCDVVDLAHAAGALVHCDGVQASGKLAMDFAALEVDLLSLSAHKFGGPQGVGALVVRSGLDLKAQHRGGGQERNRRAGTENLPGIVGFGAAAATAEEVLAAQPCLALLRDDMEARLAQVAPEVVFFGRQSERLANTSCFALPGVRAETQLMALDLAGVAVSAGSACSSGKVAPSHVLKAMGAEDDLAGAALRVSLGWQTSEAEVDRLVEAWIAFYNRSRAA